MSGLDSRYISSIDLEPFFISNQNGEPNAGGVVTFYKDDNRSQQKPVFQLTQDAQTGVYSYVQLPNPITLSGVGTFQNAAGDNIAVYYFPFDQFGNQELYYITVYDAFGNLQFTREAWPFPHNGTEASASAVGLTNQLSNPQFADVYFIGTTLTINIGGAGTTTYEVAPGWTLSLTATGAAVVTVTQTPVAGSSGLLFNPPYTLDFSIPANITVCQLIQTLHNTPAWATPTVTGIGGYLAASLLFGYTTGTTGEVQMIYKPSTGTSTTILDQSNTLGANKYLQLTQTTELPVSNNTDTGATGFDQIIINFKTLPGSPSISNVQVIPVSTNITGVEYDQTPVNRQRAYYQNIVSIDGHISNGNTGRLTLTSGTPVTTNDVSAATTLYYTPYKGNNIWLYINSTWINYVYSEISIAVPAVASQMYDVFATVSGTNVALVLVAWTNDTTRATALTTQNGIYVQSGNLTRRYLGSFRTDASNHANDSSGLRTLWNYYNRVAKPLNFTMSTNSWTYNSTTWRQANADSTAKLNFIVGVIEDSLDVYVGVSFINNSSSSGYVAFGLNSITVPSGNIIISSNSITSAVVSAYASWITFPGNIGYNYIAWLESSAVGTTTFYGSAGLTYNDSSISATYYF